MAYSRANYDATSGFDPGDLSRKRAADVIIRKAGSFPGDATLTLRAGAGLLSVSLARAFTRCASVAVEDSEELIARAQANAVAERAADRIRLVRASPGSLPFEDDFFPLTVSAFGFHDLPERRLLGVFKEAHRVTMYGGKFLFADADFSRTRPAGIKTLNPFAPHILAELKEMGYGKVSVQRLHLSRDGTPVNLLMAKRFDAEGTEFDDEDDDDDLE